MVCVSTFWAYSVLRRYVGRVQESGRLWTCLELYRCVGAILGRQTRSDRPIGHCGVHPRVMSEEVEVYSC